MSSNSNDDPTEHPIQQAAPSGKSLSKLKRVTVSPRQRYRAHQQQQQQRSSDEEVVKNPVKVSPSAVSSTAASSITDTSDDLSTIQKAYRQHKQARRKQQRCSSLTTSLHDIIEDFQFCGLYLCELLNDTSEQDKKSIDEDVISKEERKKAMDTTFLGKMIQCGGIHQDDCFGDDCILSCHNAERDDCSAEEFL